MYTPAMDIFSYLIPAIGGLIAGLYASTVGSMSLVTFPLLIFLGLPVHIAIGTNRFASILLDLASISKFHSAQTLNLKTALPFGLITALGSIIGANLVIQIDENLLKLLSSIFLSIIFFVFIFKSKLGLKERDFQTKHKIIAAIAIFFLGIYGGFFGAGFGTFIAFIFILTGLSFLKSAAISRFIGLCMALPATLIFAFNGLINYKIGLILGLGLAIGGWIGAGFSIKKGNGYIKGLFVIIILATIVKLAVEV